MCIGLVFYYLIENKLISYVLKLIYTLRIKLETFVLSQECFLVARIESKLFENILISITWFLNAKLKPTFKTR